MGTPIQMYDGQGNKTWNCMLDIYGKVLAVDKGTEFDCPFRFQGQYADKETGLYYNRFRYYNPYSGNYINIDPIGLKGGALVYSYVQNTNGWIDFWALAPWGVGSEAFNKWWETATKEDIEKNIKAVKKHLRGGGGMHEMFPVAIAVEAKRLGFTATELKVMTIPTRGLKFEYGGMIGLHHRSSASKLFHDDLIDQLKSATTKEQAKNIITDMHNNHVIGYNSKKVTLNTH